MEYKQTNNKQTSAAACPHFSPTANLLWTYNADGGEPLFCPPWPVDQTQITNIWYLYLYLPRLFDSPFCTGAANFSGLCTLSSCASVLRVSLAISEINFACLVVATVTINKLSFHHFVPLDGPMPAS